MNARLTVTETVDALNHLGFSLTRSALWQWKARGHISPQRGYDPAEVASYLLRSRAERTRQAA